MTYFTAGPKEARAWTIHTRRPRRRRPPASSTPTSSAASSAPRPSPMTTSSRSAAKQRRQGGRQAARRRQGIRRPGRRRHALPLQRLDAAAGRRWTACSPVSAAMPPCRSCSPSCSAPPSGRSGNGAGIPAGCAPAPWSPPRPASSPASRSAHGGNNPGAALGAIATGVGFLGAGVILRRGSTVRGLSTAATFWAVAAVGTAAGLREYGLALGLTALVFFAHVVLRPLSAWIERRAPPSSRAALRSRRGRRAGPASAPRLFISTV